MQVDDRGATPPFCEEKSSNAPVWSSVHVVLSCCHNALTKLASIYVGVTASLHYHATMLLYFCAPRK